MIGVQARLLRGDVVIVAFPFTDLSGSKRRPAVVIGTGSNQQDVILAFISSVIPVNLTVCDLMLLPSAEDFPHTGLKVASIIRLNKLATIDRRLVTRRIGYLDSNRYGELDDALIEAVGINIDRYATK